MKRFVASLSILYFLFFSFLTTIRADESVSVTGSIAPQTSDFPLTISSDAITTLSQDTISTYTITYGSHLYYNDSITVEAYWPQGTITGSTNASIDGMDYVSGSASTAYGGASPVINLSLQKISWTIPSFPASTVNKTVSFQLKTNSSYTGNTSVTFPIKARIVATNYTKPYQSITNTYQYIPSAVTSSSSDSTTSQSSSNTTLTPTTTPKATTATITSNTTKPSPTPQPQSLSKPSSNSPVQNVSVVNVSDSSTQLAVNLNKVTSATVVYGFSPTTLINQSTMSVNGTSGGISLDNLDSDTTYYMQVLSKDANGKVTKSEVFAVQTAVTSAQPQVATSSLVVATDNDVLYSAGLNTQSKASDTLNKTPQIPVAQDTNYTFAFKLTKVNKIKTVLMTLSNTSVLGVSTLHVVAQPLQYSFPVVDKGDGTYGVQIKNPTTPGTYDVLVKITDFDGNVTTQKVAEIRVLKPFRVYNATSKKPIEDARIALFRLNQDTKKYELLPNLGGVSNPLYTNQKGEVSEALPKGMYKANFGRIGYKGQDNVKFTLGTTAQDDFPTIYLKPVAITPLSIFIYYRNAFTDYIGITATYIEAIQESYRFFDLIGLPTILSFIILAFLFFKMKSHIAFSHIPYYLHHHTLTLVGQKDTPYLHGNVVDNNTHAGISSATLFFTDETTQKVIGTTTTNKAGGFLFRAPKGTYVTHAFKEGYESSGQIGYTPDVRISLVQAEGAKRKLVHLFGDTLADALGLFFEFMLVFSLIFEILFFPAFGVWKTLPFLLASLLNIFLWALYLRETGKQLS